MTINALLVALLGAPQARKSPEPYNLRAISFGVCAPPLPKRTLLHHFQNI